MSGAGNPEWFLQYLTAAKTALEIFKGLRSELPKGEKADKAQEQIEAAEAALQRSKVELANALGYELCKCTFPPQIMLWKAEERTNICAVCGDKNPPPVATTYIPAHTASWIKARRGK